MNKYIGGLIFLLFFNNGCGEKYVSPPEFDPERAFTYLEKQVSFGPRVPGSTESKECRNYFYQFFDSLQLSVDSQLFSFIDPYSKKEIPLVNVVVSVNNNDKDSDRILIAAHYDCRPRSEYASTPELKEKPVSGANDGASGVAIIMELANLLSKVKSSTNIDFVLFDGEDWGRNGHLDYYSLGASEFARRGIKDKYLFGIVLDMVADKNLKIYREIYSERFAPKVNDMIWATAKKLNVAAFVDSVKETIYDDHLPINAGGVPCADIIDFDYPSWHTENDTPDKCSPQSLEQVGKIIAEIIYNKSLWPKK